jgi:hypothetical protein
MTTPGTCGNAEGAKRMTGETHAAPASAQAEALRAGQMTNGRLPITDHRLLITDY